MLYYANLHTTNSSNLMLFSYRPLHRKSVDAMRYNKPRKKRPHHRCVKEKGGLQERKRKKVQFKVDLSKRGATDKKTVEGPHF